jgi:hypothetical protein
MSAPPQTDLARQLAYGIDGALWAREVLDLDLDDWQQDIIRAYGAQLVLCSRQSGKSHSVAIRALHDLIMIYRADAMIIAASPTEEQSKELFRRLTGFYDPGTAQQRAPVSSSSSVVLRVTARGAFGTASRGGLETALVNSRKPWLSHSVSRFGGVLRSYGATRRSACDDCQIASPYPPAPAH